MILHGNVSAMWIEEDTSDGEVVGKRLVRVTGAVYGPPGAPSIIQPDAADMLATPNPITATFPATMSLEEAIAKIDEADPEPEP